MKRKLCPSCGSVAVKFAGYKKSPILVIDSEPSEMAIDFNMPFSGDAGRILRQEMYQLGLDLEDMRYGFFWQHRKPKKQSEESAACEAFFVQKLLKEISKRKVVLLMASHAVTYFTGKSVQDVGGLFIPSDYTDVPLLCSTSPRQVQHSGIGELRYALTVFRDYIKENKIQ